MRSYPDSHNVEKALKNLDLYVVMDIAWTEDCDVADYVLPIKSNFERYAFNAFQLNYPECVCTVRPPGHNKADSRKARQRRGHSGHRQGHRRHTQAAPVALRRGRKGRPETGDRMAYFGKLILWTAGHADKLPLLPAIVGETLGRAWGAPTKGVAWAALLTSPIADGLVEKAGYKPLGYHPRLDKLPKLKELFERDAAYQAVIDHPEGAVIAVADVGASGKLHQPAHKDQGSQDTHLLRRGQRGTQGHHPRKGGRSHRPHRGIPLRHLLRPPLGGRSERHDPQPQHEQVQPQLLQGRHEPDDVRDMGLKDGQMVRVTTRGGELEAPVESTYQVCRGYSMIPHHYGIRFQGEVEGQSANEITYWKDMDEITGNPTVRFVKCRIEAV
jgi:hypothetical protein